MFARTPELWATKLPGHTNTARQNYATRNHTPCMSKDHKYSSRWFSANSQQQPTFPVDTDGTCKYVLMMASWDWIYVCNIDALSPVVANHRFACA